MAQSLENKFESNGSILGYPNNPSQPTSTPGAISVKDRLSTMHDLYSYDGNPISADVSPRYGNVGNPVALPSPTKLQAFTGPQNGVAAGAGFNTYNSNNTYDSFILGQGATK
jgi:hypothetical protein